MIKEKIIMGEMTEDELTRLLSNQPPRKGSFLKTLIKGVNEGYTIPMMQKALLVSMLTLAIITGAIIQSYNNKMDYTVTAVLLAAVLGYLFGKIR